MIKKNLIWLVALLFSSLTLAQGQFKEGEHYEVIDKVKTSKPTVTEIFSFYCPACYSFEFVAKGIKKELPAGVKFEKSHVDFMRQTSPKVQQMLSRAFVVGQKLKLGDKITDAIFSHIHKDKDGFSDEDDIKKLFVANGVDAKTFDKVFNSFTVKTQARKMKKLQENLSRGNKLGGIPAVIVNGKYKLDRNKLRNMDDYNNLIRYLLTLN